MVHAFVPCKSQTPAGIINTHCTESNSSSPNEFAHRSYLLRITNTIWVVHLSVIWNGMLFITHINMWCECMQMYLYTRKEKNTTHSAEANFQIKFAEKNQIIMQTIFQQRRSELPAKERTNLFRVELFFRFVWCRFPFQSSFLFNLTQLLLSHRFIYFIWVASSSQ